MTEISHTFSENIYITEHLELDFSKASINTTSSAKIITLQQKKENYSKQQENFILNKTQQNEQSQQNTLKPTKQDGLNKKSRCFIKQISKILKKNKLNTYNKQINLTHQLWNKTDLQITPNTSKIHQNLAVSIRATNQNEQIKKMIHKSKTTKQKFNFEQFLSHMFTNKQNSKNLQQNTKSFQEEQKLKNNQRKKTQNHFCLNFKKSAKPQQNQLNQQRFLCQARNTQIQFDKITQDHTFSDLLKELKKQNIWNQNKMKSSTIKSSRMTITQGKRIQNERKNKQENLKLQRSLKRAMSNVSTTTKKLQILNKTHAQIKNSFQSNDQETQQPLNYTQTMQKIHFDKLKEKVAGKMQDYQKIKQIRDIEQKQIKKSKKKRVFSLQPKVTLTVEGMNMAISKNENQPGDLKNKLYKHQRSYAALSRTGLEYNRKESQRRRSSDKQNRLTCLAGINNSANYFRTFSKVTTREIQEFNQCKSDRVVRQLKQKYSSRSQTAKSKNLTTRPSTGKSDRYSEKSDSKIYAGIQYSKITKKEIEKEKMKQKLLVLMVECEEEKSSNTKIMRGLNVFEDYCENVDKGLKNITKQIDRYIRNNQ